MEEIIKKYLGIKKPKIVKLDIGSQNETYSINDKYLIKVFSKDAIRDENEQKIREKKEKVAEIAKKKGIHVILPYKYNGKYIQKEDIYFSIYPFVKYKALKKEEISKEYIIELAKTVRKMHGISFNVDLPNTQKRKINIDYSKYINLQENNEKIKNLLSNKKDMLKKLEVNINNSLDSLRYNQIISHNDLKLDNILWKGHIAYLIDWDATGYINHMSAANEYAYFWSETNGKLNKEYYETFMEIYLSKYKCVEDIYAVLYNTLYGKYSWLKYSLDRMQSMDKEESKRGEVAVANLIKSFESYEKNIPEMVTIINKLVNENK